MESTTSYAESSLREFAAALAARTPTPGGGSVAALLAACGAALGAMVCRFTTGPKHSAVERPMEEAGARLDAVRERAVALVDEDANAYAGVAAAMGMPKGTDAEKAARAKALQEGLRKASEVPLETMRAAAQALEILGPLASSTNRSVASDLAGATHCLEGALAIAYANVRVNVLSMRSATEAEGLDGKGRAMLEGAASILEAIRRATDQALARSA
jgi:formiminotetrahydrofolate cyclodeaminase